VNLVSHDVKERHSTEEQAKEWSPDVKSDCESEKLSYDEVNAIDHITKSDNKLYCIVVLEYMGKKYSLQAMIDTGSDIGFQMKQL
jgi:hypothetical protein